MRFWVKFSEKDVKLQKSIGVGEMGVSWHVSQKTSPKTQESLISGMSDIPVKGRHLCYQFKL